MSTKALREAVEVYTELLRVHQLNIELLEQLDAIAEHVLSNNIEIPKRDTLLSLTRKARSLLDEICSQDQGAIRRKLTANESDDKLPEPVLGRFIRYNDVIILGIKLRPPCELVVRYVLPAFRSLVAKELVNRYHFSQRTAAEKLGTTQASISHYLYSKRGDKRMKELESVASIRSLVNEIAEGIATEKLASLDAMLSFCQLCTALRNQDVICDLHRDTAFLPETCDVCKRVTET